LAYLLGFWSTIGVTVIGAIYFIVILVAGINWFLPYGDHSIMLGLEFLGWSWFLGLAFLFAAPLFSGGTLQRWLRGLSLLYGLLALVSAIGFLLNSMLSLLGFVAWGGVLVILTALLAVYFRQAAQSDRTRVRG
jgi:hypothetical protein